ncbi:MAG: carbohydrate kinase family protein [archaeon]|nr:carbohydrate kinase family protein [archaeon]
MPRVFSVGDLNVDIFTHADAYPAVGEEQNTPQITYSIGGNAANFAVAASKLGMDVYLVSAIGNDVFTQFLLNELKSAHVKPLLKKSRGANGISNIFVKKSGQRSIISCKGCLLELDAKNIGRVLLPKISKGDFVFFGGYFHLPPLHKGFSELLSRLRKKGAKIFFDTAFDEYGKWEIKKFAKKIDVLFLNDKELGMVTKTKSLESGVQKLFSFGAKKIVVKRGSEGAAFFSTSHSIKVPAQKVKAVNTTGAGDAFNAGYVFGEARGFLEEKCLRSGVFVASRRIGQDVGIDVSRREVLGHLSEI